MAKKKPDKSKKEKAQRFTTTDAMTVTAPSDTPSKRVGRPTKYTSELGKRICKAIGTSTDGLEEICAMHPDFPVKSTIYEWRYDHPEFSDWYAIARAQQADLFVDLMDDIARDGRNDWMETNHKNNPGWVVNGEVVARSRLRIDTIKWKACKMLPKLYGDKPPAEEDDPFSDSERAELHAIIANLVAKHEREY